MTNTDFSPLANHLWQSTAFAGAIWMLALALRHNHAAVRYWLWLASSFKFLIPFSLLMDAGSHLGRRTVVSAQPLQWSSVAEQISQPFTTSAAAPHVITPPGFNPVPAVLFGIWWCGMAVGIVFWLRCFRRIRAALHAATPLDLGLPILAACSSARLEPGVFGIRKPVLLLPQGIIERLTPAQLAAIVRHEMCHVRRRDNLTAALHMLVEVIFWFYPLVWWIRARLIDERENACDEDVLRSGNDATVYAEGILNVCKLYVQSPWIGMSGVAGSDLKRRIEKILDNRRLRVLSLGRKLLLVSAGMLTVTVPLVIGVINAPALRSQTVPANQLAFEVASVKLYQDDAVGDRKLRNTYGPQGIDFQCALAFAIGEAYNFPVGRIVGPGSLTREALWGALSQDYAIVAKADQPVSKDQLRLMLQSLLSDRFKLAMHREARTSPVYRLVVARDGPRLGESHSSGDFSMHVNGNAFVFANAEMIRVSGFLTGRVDRVVVDQTGLQGLYNFTLRRPEELSEDPARAKSEGISAASLSAGAFAGALKDLGLQLIAGTAPVDYLVIDHVERPSEN